MTEQPDSQQIEITPEMIEAGQAVFLDWAGNGDFDVPTKTPDLIKGVFLAMAAFCGGTSRPKGPESHN